MRFRVWLAALVVAAVGVSGAIITRDVVEAPKAEAARYCPYPWQGSCYWTWLRCGPYLWNPWTGLYMDRCLNFLV